METEHSSFAAAFEVRSDGMAEIKDLGLAVFAFLRRVRFLSVERRPGGYVVFVAPAEAVQRMYERYLDDEAVPVKSLNRALASVKSMLRQAR